MREQINKSVLCILRYQANSKKIILDYYTIEELFKPKIDELVSKCDDENSDIEVIRNTLLNQKKTITKLNGSYGYCEFLNGAFQEFTINIEDKIKEIEDEKKLILDNAKENPETYNANKYFGYLKSELKREFILWGKAYSINIAYKQCYDNKEILTFSHRINGWSNPIYNLSNDFSIELKTNFGYGRASYFYTILKYKEIEITPFSEWIDYEFAKFSEIIRYTQSYILENVYWQDAMEYARDACNLSMTDETQFLLVYVIEECEKMTNGLDDIIQKDHFTFKKRGIGKYSVDKKGHLLTEFRGEKISGALDFITKIIEYKKITEVQSYVNKIESSNKKIQPLLANEAIVIEEELRDLKYVLAEKTPEYKRVQEENRDYSKKKTKLSIKLITNGILDKKHINQIKLDKEFESHYPDYYEFKNEFDKICKAYYLLREQIGNLENVLMNILKYNKRIIKYFKDKKE